MAMQGCVRGKLSATLHFRHEILVLSAAREGICAWNGRVSTSHQDLTFCQVATPEEALSLISARDFELVVIDGDEPTWNPQGVIQALKAKKQGVVCAIMVETGDEESWLNALSAGALDLIEKHQVAEDIAHLLRRLSHRPAA